MWQRPRRVGAAEPATTARLELGPVPLPHRLGDGVRANRAELVDPAPALDHAELVQQRGLAFTQETLEDRLEARASGLRQADVEVPRPIRRVSGTTGLGVAPQVNVEATAVGSRLVPGSRGRELAVATDLPGRAPAGLGRRLAE